MGKTKLYKMMPMEVYKDGIIRSVLDPIVYETELKIIYNGNHIATIASSPDAVRELAVGYLIGQEVISRKDRINSIDIEKENIVKVTSTKIEDCGVQGDSHSAPSGGHKGTIPLCSVWPAPKILELIGELDSRAYTFKKTGGVHSAALGSLQGLLIKYEDIGRHNAVDKALGHAFLQKIPLTDKCLVLSGRVSAEIVRKALGNQIPIVVSRSAPTLLAVRMAAKAGMTIIGFARGERFNIYSHSQQAKIQS